MGESGMEITLDAEKKYRPAPEIQTYVWKVGA
jgi:hypothetical protein